MEGLEPSTLSGLVFETLIFHKTYGIIPLVGIFHLFW